MDEEYKNFLEQILVEHNTYLSQGLGILNSIEAECINFMLTSFRNSQQFPSQTLFESVYPQTIPEFVGMTELPLEDFRVYIGNKVSYRTNKQIAVKMESIKSLIETEGMSEELMGRLEEFKKLSDRTKSKDIQVGMDFRSIYEQKLTKPVGLTTGIEEIDQRIGGMSEGTITTIAGFTSHFKTTHALNIAHRCTYHKNFNLIYLSLETPKEDMYFNLLCRHSYESKFKDISFVPHDRIRKCELSPEELDHLYNVVEPDLSSPITDDMGNIVYDDEGKTYSRGKLIILDESDFVSMSFTDIYNTFEKIDDMLGGRLDGFFVDYIQLCKFIENQKGMDDNRMINSYVTFFRRMTMNFRSGKLNKKLIGVLLAQINRVNWIKAVKKCGVYDLTCLADANELERGSYRVITTYTDEDMKNRSEAQLQILKNRGGPTMWNPHKIYANGESYVFGEEMEKFGATLGGNANSGMMGDILGSLGDMDNII